MKRDFDNLGITFEKGEAQKIEVDRKFQYDRGWSMTITIDHTRLRFEDEDCAIRLAFKILEARLEDELCRSAVVEHPARG